MQNLIANMEEAFFGKVVDADKVESLYASHEGTEAANAKFKDDIQRLTEQIAGLSLQVAQMQRGYVTDGNTHRKLETELRGQVVDSSGVESSSWNSVSTAVVPGQLDSECRYCEVQFCHGCFLYHVCLANYERAFVSVQLKTDTLGYIASMNEELQLSSVEAPSLNSGSTAVNPGPLQSECNFFACPAAARSLTLCDKVPFMSTISLHREAQ